MRTIVLLAFSLGAHATAQVVLVSAASPSAAVAPDSLATIFGSQLASQTAAATSLPWPTSLGGVSGVVLMDSASKSQTASLLYVSPTQINIWVPPGTAPGPATLSIPGVGLYPVTIQKVAPGLFSLSGTGAGVAAATAMRVMNPTTTTQTAVPVFQCSSYACAALPIDVGLDTPVYLSLYGTGIRGASSLSNVAVTIGGLVIPAAYAGLQPQTPGLDQINVPLVLTLRGRGLVDVTVTVDGVTSNAVQIAIQ